MCILNWCALAISDCFFCHKKDKGVYENSKWIFSIFYNKNFLIAIFYKKKWQKLFSAFFWLHVNRFEWFNGTFEIFNWSYCSAKVHWKYGAYATGRTETQSISLSVRERTRKSKVCNWRDAADHTVAYFCHSGLPCKRSELVRVCVGGLAQLTYSNIAQGRKK